MSFNSLAEGTVFEQISSVGGNFSVLRSKGPRLLGRFTALCHATLKIWSFDQSSKKIDRGPSTSALHRVLPHGFKRCSSRGSSFSRPTTDLLSKVHFSIDFLAFSHLSHISFCFLCISCNLAATAVSCHAAHYLRPARGTAVEIFCLAEAAKRQF
jgi:hypothetical protein